MDLELSVRSLIISTVVSSAFYAVMMWTAGALASVNDTGNVYTLRYGWVFRAAGYFSIAGAAFFAIVWHWPLFDRLPEPGDGWIALGLVVLCAGVGVCLLNEARVLLSSQGIEVLFPVGPHGQAALAGGLLGRLLEHGAAIHDSGPFQAEGTRERGDGRHADRRRSSALVLAARRLCGCAQAV